MKSLRQKYSKGTQSIFLPHEVITQIFSFLPVKHLMQLKCVCKSWKTLISDDSTLVKLHLKKFTTKRVALFSFRHKDHHKLCLARFPLHENTSATRLTIDKEPELKLTDVFGQFLYPVGCCNGLLCLVGYILINNRAEIWLYLCNPATNTFSNKIVFLSMPHDRRSSSSFQHGWKFAFGYDNSTDTYKIAAFHIWNNNVRVFNFGDNVWRNIQSFSIVPVDRCGFPSDYPEDGPHPGINNRVYVSGTLNCETYLQLLPPWDFDELPCLQPTLFVLMNCLCLSFSHGSNGTDFIIWQMKDFGVQESWIQFLKISYKNIRSLMSYNRQSFLFPVCLSENGDTLILAWGTSNKEAILYSLRDNSVKKSRKFTNEIRWYLAKDYVESLVSTG
ncbi:hypothetical protein TSUD_175540 [Trifolium subterraneum]|uniref:F-box domain-containing protein n=1 Tax=Trifolium subterraneum TaxID=3900 RepID=A0A2Z6NNN3_TRISU|nr:hypothetical protein TSUD_175540 [Trifolium subterraneum]